MQLKSAVNLSVVIPCYKEADNLYGLLACLSACSGIDEIIVVDADALDDPSITTQRPSYTKTRYVTAEQRQRAAQLQQGVTLAQGQYIWMLHSDSQLSSHCFDALWQALQSSFVWGRFDVRFDKQYGWLHVVATLINWRSALSGICTGDQGIIVQQAALQRIGGIPQQALMEDVELSKRLKNLAKPRRIRQFLVTSSRRWRQGGTWPTILLMWKLRWLYFRGADPATLAAMYRHAR